MLRLIINLDEQSTKEVTEVEFWVDRDVAQIREIDNFGKKPQLRSHPIRPLQEVVKLIRKAFKVLKKERKK